MRLRILCDKLSCWCAYHLPRSIAKWAFIRVYTFANHGTPSREGNLVLSSWDQKVVLKPDIYERMASGAEYRQAIQLGPSSEAK